jgi:hypothetical protein
LLLLLLIPRLLIAAVAAVVVFLSVWVTRQPSISGEVAGAASDPSQHDEKGCAHPLKNVADVRHHVGEGAVAAAVEDEAGAAKHEPVVLHRETKTCIVYQKKMVGEARRGGQRLEKITLHKMNIVKRREMVSNLKQKILQWRKGTRLYSYDFREHLGLDF